MARLVLLLLWLGCAAAEDLSLRGPADFLRAAALDLRAPGGTVRYGWTRHQRTSPGLALDGWGKIVATETTRYWRDANGNGQQDAGEVRDAPVFGFYRITGDIGWVGMTDERAGAARRWLDEWPARHPKLNACAVGDAGLSGLPNDQSGSWLLLAVRGCLRLELRLLAEVQVLVDDQGGLATARPDDLKSACWLDRDALGGLLRRVDDGRDAALRELGRQIVAAYDEWAEQLVADGPGPKGLFGADLHPYWLALADLPRGAMLSELSYGFDVKLPDNGGKVEVVLRSLPLTPEHLFADMPLLEARGQFRVDLEHQMRQAAEYRTTVRQGVLPLADESWQRTTPSNVFLGARLRNVVLRVSSYSQAQPKLVLPLAEAALAKLRAACRPRPPQPDVATPPKPPTPPEASTGPAQLTLRWRDASWQGVACDPLNRLELEAEPPRGGKSEAVRFAVRARDGVVKDAGTLVDASLVGRTARVWYSPPAETAQPFTAEITATWRDGEREEQASVAIAVVQPPLVFVHGVWSNPKAWEDAIEPHQQRFAALGYNLWAYFDYAASNSEDPAVIARGLLGSPSLSQVVDSLLTRSAQRGTLAGRVDLVGHSMGGLVSRRYLADGGWARVRKLVTVATPHEGSPFAAWFAYFARAKQPGTPPGSMTVPPEVQANPKWRAGNTAWTNEAFTWLVRTVRSQLKLDASFFRDGPAVDALMPRSAFLQALNAADPHDQDVRYYFLYGSEPLQRADQTFWANAGIDATAWKANEVMFDTFFDHISAGGTDGVVPFASAKGAGLNIRLARPPIPVQANHVSITGAAIDRLLECLGRRP